MINTEAYPNDIDEIWKINFNEDIPLFPTLNDFISRNHLKVDLCDILNDESPELEHTDQNEILQHDCMWSGTCISKEHPAKKKVLKIPSCFSDIDNLCGDEEVDVGSEIENESMISSISSLNLNSESVKNTSKTEINEKQSNVKTSDSLDIKRNNFIFNNLKSIACNQSVHLQQIYQNVSICYEGESGVKYESNQIKPEQETKQVQKIYLFTEHSVQIDNNNNILHPSVNLSTPMVTYHQNDIRKEKFVIPSSKKRKLIIPKITNKFKNLSTKKLLKNARKKAQPLIFSEDLNGRMKKYRYVRQPQFDSFGNVLEKRSMHNCMERQRRIGLKNLFQELKLQIPTINTKERVPKVSILREAVVYCNKLRKEELNVQELQKINNRLKMRLKKLSSSFFS